MRKSQYVIKFGGLPVGIHEFEFDVKDDFFRKIENSEIASADVKVQAVLTKQNNVLQVQFTLNGMVDVECDRCLKSFGYPVEAEEKLVIKHGNTSESTDEILVIPPGEEEFDASQYLYEYIVTAMPARKVPCELDAEKYRCDYEVLSKLDELATEEDKSEEEDKNPVWEKLSKIKFNKN